MTQLPLRRDKSLVVWKDEWKDYLMAVKWVEWKVVLEAVEMDMQLGNWSDAVKSVQLVMN